MVKTKIKNNCRIRLILSLFIALAIPLGLAIISDRQFYRYSLTYGPCINKIINSQRKEFDLVIVGGSRVLAGLNPYELTDVFLKDHDKDLQILNIAAPWYGMDYSYPILRDLMKQHKVKNLLIAAQMQPEEIYHPFAFMMYEMRDFIEAFTVFESNPVEHVSSLIKAMLERFRRVITRNSGGWDKWERDLAQLNSEIKYCLLKQNLDDKTDVKQAKQDAKTLNVRQVGPQYSHDDNRFSIHYYKKIAGLAGYHGTKIQYIWLPRIDFPYWTENVRTVISFKRVINTDSVVFVNA